MATITIDGKQFDSESLSEEAKQQLSAIQYVDRKLADLNAEASVLQTARIAYAKALSESLPKDETVSQ